jgi:hypothetical protein
LRKLKKIIEKYNYKKKPIKHIKILKKLIGSVRFWFYKLEIKKNRTELKLKKNRVKPQKTKQIKKTKPNKK